jgi:predicted MFS family arabinose efflux permease
MTRCSGPLARLTLLICAMAVVTSVLHTAVAPLLPWLEDEIGLSKTQAGLLVGAYPLGLTLVSVPVALLAPRLGVRRCAVLSLGLLALGSVGFSISDSYLALVGLRLIQGLGAGISIASGLAWIVQVAPRERRAEMIGVTSGARSAGQMIGFAVGGLAVISSVAVVFTTIAACAVGLAALTSRHEQPMEGMTGTLAELRQFDFASVAGGQWLIALPGVLLGANLALVPLHLSDRGWGATSVAVTFLVAAAAGVIARPWIGRWADRHGLLPAIKTLVIACVPLTLVMPWIPYTSLYAVAAIVATTLYGVVIGPAMARLATTFEQAGLSLISSFALMGLSGSLGLFLGSGMAGAVADHAGDGAAYGVAAGLALLTAIWLTWFMRPQPEPSMASG